MNFSIGQKLQKLRKQHGLSQEDIAEELKVSRQAVSKWERDETSPDTDNLICLAKLYKISLDELVGIETTDKAPNACAEEKEEFAPCCTDKIIEENKEDFSDCDEAKTTAGKFAHAVTPLLSAFFFCMLGGIWKLWHPAWIIFFCIPIVSTLVVAIEKRKFSVFAFPCFVVAAYFCFGCIWGLWHPTWIIFITIPIYYVIAGFIDERSNRKKQ